MADWHQQVTRHSTPLQPTHSSHHHTQAAATASYYPSHHNQNQRGDYYSSPSAYGSVPHQPPHGTATQMQTNATANSHHHQHHSSQSGCMCCPPRPSGPYHHSQPVYSDYHPATMASDVAADRHTNNNIDDRNSEYFPQDPREWTDIDVSKWLHWAARRYSLVDTHPERFQMNGKALCLMDLSMFVYRVPDGGDLLYQDFQGRLQQVLYDDRPR